MPIVNTIPEPSVSVPIVVGSVMISVTGDDGDTVTFHAFSWDSHDKYRGSIPKGSDTLDYIETMYCGDRSPRWTPIATDCPMAGRIAHALAVR